MDFILSALIYAIGALPFAIVYSFAVYSILRWLIGINQITWFKSFLCIWLIQIIIDASLAPKHVNDYRNLLAICGFILIFGIAGWVKSLIEKKPSKL
jgi:hypothetical protein